MYELLHNEKQYLSELKEVTLKPQVVDEYLGYIQSGEEILFETWLSDLMKTPLDKLLKPLKDKGFHQYHELKRLQSAQQKFYDMATKAKRAGDMKGFNNYSKMGKDMAPEIRAVDKRLSMTGSLIQKKMDESSIFQNTPYLVQIAAATVLAALLAWAAAKVYKNYLSKAAKACTGQGGIDKQICMINFKIKGAAEAKKRLASATGYCNKSKTPDKCKAAIMKKAAKFDQQITKLNDKLSKLQVKKKARG